MSGFVLAIKLTVRSQVKHSFTFLLFLSFFITFEARSVERNDELVDAAARGFNEAVKMAIDTGADVNTVNSNHTSLVLVAATKNNLELLRMLLSVGANPNLSNAQNATPLYAACMLGNPGIINLLLQHGADPNIAMDRYLATPLMLAAVNDRLETVKILMDFGAIPEIRNNEGKTVLDLVDPSEQPNMSALLRGLDDGS